MGLGLGKTSQEVSFIDNNLGLLTNMFNGEDITVVSIVEKLNEKKLNSKKECRKLLQALHIACFCRILFP